MSTIYSFDDKAVKAAIDAIKESTSEVQTTATEKDFNLVDGGELEVLAECIEVKVENGKVCVKLPLGIGKKCIKLPITFPDGTVGKVCLSICSTWGIPTGVKLTVSIKGQTVLKKVFGKC